MSEQNKTIELNDEELEKVTGGANFNPGEVISPADVFFHASEWFIVSGSTEFIYFTLSAATMTSNSIVAAKYWYNGSNEAWNMGSCSLTYNNDWIVVNPPTIIHTDAIYTNKPVF